MNISKGNYINGTWTAANGIRFSSISPIDGEVIWSGNGSSEENVSDCISAAKAALSGWSNLSLEDRISYVKKFAEIVKANQDAIAQSIALEIGKPLWEAKTEASALIGKVDSSINAYKLRNKEIERPMANNAVSKTQFKPLGIIATISPYNFPAHMANGHIIPALICGNCVIWKPSEKGALVAEKVMELWEQTGLPKGVLSLLQGGGDVGAMLSENSDITGVFFTGSYAVGQAISKACATDKLCALEMGGDSPLVVWEVEDIDSAAIGTIQSAYITSGQRCSAARRVIIEDNEQGNAFLQRLIYFTKKIKVGNPFDTNQPYMGPMRESRFVDGVFAYQNKLLKAGAKAVIKSERIPALGDCYLTPGIINVTEAKGVDNEEVVGPLIRITRVKSFDDAIREANNSEYGLAAGIFTDRKELYEQFNREIRAGLINWNQQLTGASGMAPFGGIKHSGNFRPSGYLAVDYCVYAVASIEIEKMPAVVKLPTGFTE